MKEIVVEVAYKDERPNEMFLADNYSHDNDFIFIDFNGDKERNKNKICIPVSNILRFILWYVSEDEMIRLKEVKCNAWKNGE
jgi:hypothetical protein